jgi:hypothetical protein
VVAGTAAPPDLRTTSPLIFALFSQCLLDACKKIEMDPKNQSGVFLGFAHRRNIYGAQILVDKSIITAKHQIAYDIELFPFQQRDNSNDRLQFLQWLLKRKTATISNVALDSDNPNSETSITTPYLPNNSITIDDSSDDEHVSTHTLRSAMWPALAGG